MNKGIRVIKETCEMIQLNINDNRHLFYFNCNDTGDVKEVYTKLFKVDYEEYYVGLNAGSVSVLVTNKQAGLRIVVSGMSVGVTHEVSLVSCF